MTLEEIEQRHKRTKLIRAAWKADTHQHDSRRRKPSIVAPHGECKAFRQPESRPASAIHRR